MADISGRVFTAIFAIKELRRSLAHGRLFFSVAFLPRESKQPPSQKHHRRSIEGHSFCPICVSNDTADHSNGLKCCRVNRSPNWHCTPASGTLIRYSQGMTRGWCAVLSSDCGCG